MKKTEIKPKISTGIAGLDDLFYGGLRLPRTDGQKGICIAIYGNRGISKQDIALQIMYGVSKVSHTTCRYFDINRNMEEMKARYYGLHIGRVIQQIRQPKNIEKIHCDLCKHFNLTEIIVSNGSVTGTNGEEVSFDKFSIAGCRRDWTNPYKVECQRDEETRKVDCDLCKMIRHEIINYNDRTQSLHWTVDESSDESNKFAEKKNDCEDIFSSVFEDKNKCMEDDKYKTPIQKYNIIRQKIKNLPDHDLDSIVIGGFTAIGDDLERLQYNNLMDLLRDKAEVSILVFDERGKDLHLNADIIIEMRIREDEETQYIHHELRVTKSDLQRHVYGWHHYKKLRDLSIEVYPNVHTLMSRRFASTYALARLNRDSCNFPQPLLQKFQDNVNLENKQGRNEVNEQLINILKDIKDRPLSEEKKSHLTIDVQNHIDIPKLIQNTENNTTLVLLFGRDEIAYYDRIKSEANQQNKSEYLSHIHCWSVRPSDILPEEILGVVKQYLHLWWDKHKDKSTLHIYLDDIAQFWLYPLLVKERNFIPALFSICNDVRFDREFDKPLVIHNVILHLVYSSDSSIHCKYVVHLKNWNKK